MTENGAWPILRGSSLDTWLFLRLAAMQWPAWMELSKYGSQQASRVAAEKGMDWQQMSDEEREEFIDQILHERATGLVTLPTVKRRQYSNRHPVEAGGPSASEMIIAERRNSYAAEE